MVFQAHAEVVVEEMDREMGFDLEGLAIARVSDDVVIGAIEAKVHRFAVQEFTMKLIHLFRKAIFRARVDGLRDILKELFYVNRTMVVIEKDIRQSQPIEDRALRFVVVEGKSLKNHGRWEWPPVQYYCSEGARCIKVYRRDQLIGYQFYTQENSFADLVKIGLTLGRNEAYLFDLFVFPEHRGSDVTKKMAAWTFQHLLSKGINKFYGFYFSDNLRSLWWHRAILKCKEIKKLRVHRLFLVEWKVRRRP